MPAAKLSHAEAIEALLADRLNKRAGFVEVPVPLFVARVEVHSGADAGGGEALPPINLYVS